MKSQKGFTLVEGLLVIIAAGIITFGGYYVWSNQKDKALEETKTTQQEQQNNENEQESAVGKASLPSGWNQYTDEQIGLKIPYPSEWGTISVKALEWEHDGKGYTINFSNSDVWGMIANKDYRYTGLGRGGASWEFSSETFQEALNSAMEDDEKAKTNSSYSTRVLESQTKFYIMASADCMSNGANMVATYDVSNTNNSNMSLLRLSSRAKPAPADCQEVTRDNVVDYIDSNTRGQFILLGSLI